MAVGPIMVKETTAFAWDLILFCFIESSCYMNRQIFWNKKYLLDHQDQLLTPAVIQPHHT